MDDETNVDELLTFFKVMIDPDRLAIAGRLAHESLTIEALAVELNLTRIDVQHHLARLIDATLVTESDQVYALDRAAMHSMARRTFASTHAVSPPANYDEKVLADYLQRDGSLKEIPVQLKKKHVIYRHVAVHLESGRRYTEKEVNELLERFYPDAVSMRRDLFDLGYIDRHKDGSAYWRIES